MSQMITRQGADALIPQAVASDIIRAVPENTYALRFLKRLPNMTARQRRLPILESLVSAGFVSGDTGLKMTTEAQWGSKCIEAEEIAAIVPIPEAVLGDAGYDIWGELKPQLVEAIGAVIDAAILFGADRPTSWPQGLTQLAQSAGNVVSIGTDVDIAADVSCAMSAVEQDGFDVGGMLTDVAFRGNLRSLRDLNNNPIYQPGLTAAAPNLLYGVRIEHVKNGAWDSLSARMLLGDFSQAMYAIRQDVTYKVLDQAVISDADGKIIYNLAQQDMVALRVVMRLGWQVANPVNRLNPGSEARFPFAVLTP